ncbi:MULTISPECIES: hypothetical protein [Sphingobium]|nr:MULTISPECIES: hypothetical protein [Sphingobium]
MSMKPLRALIDSWLRLRDAARREFLRDPNVILFERAPQQESAGGR